MIRRLRRRHARFAFVWIAACVPVGLVVALASRRAIPTLSSLPAELVGRIGEPIGTVRRWSAEVDGVTVDFAMWGVGNERYVEVDPHDDVEKPDVLVYFTRGPGSSGADARERLPDDALLIGTLAGTTLRRFALPKAAADGGRLLFYSLAHQREIGGANLSGS